MILDLNIFTGWISILCGIASGVGMGLFFDRENWLGGYGSWARRMLRLGHVAFFGVGVLNIAYATTVKYLEWSRPPEVCSLLLAASCALMPGVCFLAAVDRRWRHGFAAPVLCVLAGVVGVLAGRI